MANSGSGALLPRIVASFRSDTHPIPIYILLAYGCNDGIHSNYWLLFGATEYHFVTHYIIISRTNFSIIIITRAHIYIESNGANAYYWQSFDRCNH